MPHPIEDLLNAIAGAGHEASITMEVVQLKDGQSIEDVIKAKGLKPIGEKCEGCGVQHEYEDAQGQRVFVSPEDDVQNETEVRFAPKDEFNDRRTGALEGIRRRQANVLRMYDILKEMEESIEQPRDDRNIGTLLNEVTLYAELRVLAGKL